MIVSCPNCSKRYMLDDALLPKEGRQVRCVACHHTWRQVPDLSFMNNTSYTGNSTIAVEPRPSLEKRSSWMGWILSFGIILSAFSFLWFGRDYVVRVWPRTERFYELAGLKTNHPGAGLSIANASSLIQQDGPSEMIKVVGDIINTSDQVRSIPPLKIKLKGELSDPKCVENKQGEGCVLDYWEHSLSEKSLLPGEKIHFETNMRSRVEGTQQISVEF
jgi:predicted Zn finger-like uncharacterized protein